MIEFYKVFFDNVFDSLRKLQVQNEETFDALLGRVLLAPDPVKKFFMDCILEIHKVETAVLDLNKTAMDDYFEGLEKLFPDVGRPAPAGRARVA